MGFLFSSRDAERDRFIKGGLNQACIVFDSIQEDRFFFV